MPRETPGDEIEAGRGGESREKRGLVSRIGVVASASLATVLGRLSNATAWAEVPSSTGSLSVSYSQGLMGIYLVRTYRHQGFGELSKAPYGQLDKTPAVPPCRPKDAG